MKENFQIPAIHNYYSDLLLSLAYFFDHQVFGEDSIHGYQFNIGSKTLQLDYKSQVSLPSAIINYQQSEMTQYHDWFIRRPDLTNPFLIPIVYDVTKDLTLLLQEASYEHSISVTINYESVMQMLEAEHKLRTMLPMNKYIEYFTFYTFYEIPQIFLNPIMFDTNRDEIFNLFTKRDSLTDDLVEMASVKYNPMIRLNSIGSMGISSDNRTFSLSIDFTLLNPVPMYFQFASGDVPKINKHINEVTIDEICLPIYENVPIVQIKYFESAIDKYVTKYVPLLNIDENNNFETVFNGYKLIGKIKSRWDTYQAIIESDNYSYPVTIKIERTKNTYSIIVSGALEGNIINPKWNETEDEIEGIFNGHFNLNNIDKQSNIVEDVILTLKVPTKNIQFNLDSVELYNLETSERHLIDNILTIPYGQLTLLNNNFNDSRLNFVPDKSLVTGLGTYNTNYNSIDFQNITVPISESGTIQVSSNFTTSINNEDFTEYYSITGCINPFTWKYSFTQINEQESVLSYPIYIIISGTFNNEPKYGASYIEHINLDIAASYKNSPVYITTTDRYFHDFLFLKRDNENLIFSGAISNTRDYVEFDCDYAYIKLTQHDDIKFKSTNFAKLFWTLIFKDHTYNSLNTNFELVTIQKKFYCAIAIKIPIKIYTLNFGKYNTSNDVFFIKIYEDRGSINAQVSKS